MLKKGQIFRIIRFTVDYGPFDYSNIYIYIFFRNYTIRSIQWFFRFQNRSENEFLVILTVTSAATSERSVPGRRFVALRFLDPLCPQYIYIYIYIYFFFVYYMTLQAYAKFTMKNKKFWPILGFSP